MKALRFKAWVVMLLMLTTWLGARAWTPTHRLADTRPKVDLAVIFPKTFGDWRVDYQMPVQLVSPDLQVLLNKIYNQTLSRTYINGQGERVMLSVAYGGDQSDGTSAHLPEVCYPAQGFQIISKLTTALTLGQQSVPVVHLVAKLGGRVEPITYWLVVGDRIALSGTDQKLAQISYTVRGLIPDGMLVRVSTVDSDQARSYRIQAGFVADMVAALPVQDREFVVGAGH